MTSETFRAGLAAATQRAPHVKAWVALINLMENMSIEDVGPDDLRIKPDNPDNPAPGAFAMTVNKITVETSDAVPLGSLVFVPVL